MSAQVTEVEVSKIQPSPFQVREKFDEKKLDELTQNMSRVKQLQPIVVRKVGGKLPYEIVCGERRFRASQKLALKTIMAIVRDLDDVQARIASLSENYQRENLSPAEVWKAVKGIYYDERGKSRMTILELATKTGISDTYLTEIFAIFDRKSETTEPSLRKAVERYYESQKPMTTVEKNPLPSVSLSAASAIRRGTSNLPKHERGVVQEEFATHASKAGLSRDQTRKAIDYWQNDPETITPKKAVTMVTKEVEDLQDSAADVVWVQFDKELQDGIKAVRERHHLPSVRDTILYLVRYALEDMNLIESKA